MFGVEHHTGGGRGVTVTGGIPPAHAPVLAGETFLLWAGAYDKGGGIEGLLYGVSK